MAQNAKTPADAAVLRGSRAVASEVDKPGFTAPTAYQQAAYLSARFGLAAHHARLVAALAWEARS